MVAGNKTTFSSCSYRIAGGSPRVYCLRLPISLELDRLRDENPLGLAPARQQHSNYLGDCCCCVVCLRRASARSLQIILALVGNNNGVAIIGVQLKNNGRTRIKTERTENKQESESCYFYAKEVKVFDPKPITPLVVRGFDSGRIRIFKKLIELEPGEVVSEDVPLALKITLFEVHVEFHALGATEDWGATAVFSADEKTKSSSTIDLPTEQTATSGENVSS